MNKTVCIVAVVAIGVSFYGGMKYGISQAAVARAAQRQAGGFGGGRGGGFGNGGGAPVAGEIVDKSDKGFTVKLRDGGSKIVFTSDTTTIMKSVSGTADDLKIGQTVVVMGATNSDGSVTAQSVQLRPAFPSPSTSPKQ